MNDILNEIRLACCGKDEEGNPRCGIALETQEWSFDETQEPRTIASHTLIKPVIEIKKHGDYFQVDLIFKTHLDTDLASLWNQFDKYSELLDAMNEESEEMPSITLTISPTLYDGEYYILCTAPIFWTLQPQKPDGQANVIRILFPDDGIGFFETDEIDVEAIDSDIEREYAQEEAYLAQLEQKETEYSEKINDRNSRIENLRGGDFAKPNNENEQEEDNDNKKEENKENSSGYQPRFRYIE